MPLFEHWIDQHCSCIDTKVRTPASWWVQRVNMSATAFSMLAWITIRWLRGDHRRVSMTARRVTWITLSGSEVVWGTSYEVWGGSRSRRVRDWQRLEFVTLSLLFDCPPESLILDKFNLNYVKRVNPPNSQKDQKTTLKRASIFSSSSTKSPIFCFTGLDRSITSSGLKLDWM